MSRLKRLRVGEPVELEPHDERGIQLIARLRGITPHEVVKRAVSAYVSACFEDTDRLTALAEAGEDREPDLRSRQGGTGAFPG